MPSVFGNQTVARTSKYFVHTIIITVTTVQCRHSASPAESDAFEFIFTSRHFPLPLHLAYGLCWVKPEKGVKECSPPLNLSAWLSGLPRLAPYLTSFPTTPHYTPSTVVKPVSPRHPTHFSGPFLMLEHPPPSLHLCDPPNISHLQFLSLLKRLLSAHSAVGIMPSARAAENKQTFCRLVVS